jgi:hypothetical protein
MFEEISIDEVRTPNSLSDRPGTKSTRDSIELQIGVLKEVAFSLLRQLDVIKLGRASEHGIGAKTLHDEVRDFEIELINSA